MAASFSLSQDNLAEILKRLPVCSIIKFMLVQKSWYHLIQSPYFNTLYSQHQKNNYILFHCSQTRFISLFFNNTQYNHYSSLTYPHIDPNGHYRKIYGISNGLICVGVSTQSMDTELSHIYLWNPIIRKYKTLPQSPILDYPTCIRSFYSLFFGYVPEINDYKLIEIVQYLNEGGKHLSDKVGVLVYSLSTNSWKTVSKDNFAKSEKFENPVIVNGAVYWVGETEESMLLVCFDIESEIIREIMLPSGYISYDLVNKYSLAQNCSDLFLCCRDYFINGNHHILDIWILEKEAGIKDVWRKKFTLDHARIEKAGGWWFPHCFRNNNEIILTSDGVTHGFRYMSYDIEKDEPTEIIDDLSDLFLDICPWEMKASLFVENLVLLGDNNS